MAVLGGGAAGFFGAIACAEANPGLSVVLIEKTGKLLGKVRVSGGGRCNVTHACDTPTQLAAHYPRGSKLLKAAFQQFGVPETIAWFAKRGVALKTEPDGRMFPTTDSSETIARTLEDAARRAGVRILPNTSAEAIEPLADGRFRLTLSGSGTSLHGGTPHADRLLVATGGNPKSANYDWLRALGHTIAEPVPSLFTFNVPQSPLSELMGVSVPQARVVLAGEKLHYEGPLLVTVSARKRQKDRSIQPPIWPAPTPVAQPDGTSRHCPRCAVERAARQGAKLVARAAAAHPAGGARQNHLQGRIRDLRRHHPGRSRLKNHGKPPGAQSVFRGRGAGY